MKKVSAVLLLCIVCFLSAKAQFSNAPITPAGLNVGISIISDGDTTEIEPIKYYKQKIGTGAFLSGLTYGATKTKNKNFYKGKNSPNKVKVGDKIRFAFGDVPAQFMSTHYMFQPTYTIRNFSLCKFDIKKDHRELTTGEFSLWSGSDVGTEENKDVKFVVFPRDGGIYECTIVKAAPGEYCLLFSDNGVGAYMNIFDFSVAPEKKK